MWPFILLPLIVYLVYVYYFRIVPKENVLQAIPMADLLTMPEAGVRNYIGTYAVLAQAEMRQSKIPASITLAQAILESQYGTSPLAKQANNHFGIKVDVHKPHEDKHCIHSNEWDKETKKMKVLLSCFRKYEKVADCFAHHSAFLMGRAWYAPLFELDMQDYRAWAKGLQRAGYATDPKYAPKLIALIEKYQLNRYDKLELNGK